MNEPRFAQVSIDVPPLEIEEASTMLFDLGAGGVEERDAETLARAETEGRITLVASFTSDEAASHAAQGLCARWSARRTDVVGDAWRDAYKEHFRPFRLTETVLVCPPWQRVGPERRGDIVLELEPGRAFGTGLHATTRGVASVLEAERARLRRARVLDVGAGSGILSFVALALGAASVRGIDIDADAVACARENAERNAMTPWLTFDTTPLQAVEASYDWVLANIEASVLVPLAPHIAARVGPEGTLVVSGVLAEQKDEVRTAYAELDLADERPDGEWVVLVLRRS
jgi:ribosomal protein L11 methyltransferase